MAFNKCSGRKDGLQRYCKKCIRAYPQKSRRAEKKIYYRTIVGCLKQKFAAMKFRCNNPTAHNFANYGGRGVFVKFENSQEFVDYVINNLRVDPRGLEIDRINNDGHYEPGNIQFVTRDENLKKRKFRKDKT